MCTRAVVNDHNSELFSWHGSTSGKMPYNIPKNLQSDSFKHPIADITRFYSPPPPCVFERKKSWVAGVINTNLRMGHVAEDVPVAVDQSGDAIGRAIGIVGEFFCRLVRCRVRIAEQHVALVCYFPVALAFLRCHQPMP